MSSKPKLLVVDDDDTLRTLFQNILSTQGETHVAEDALVAYDLIMEHRYDCILSDIKMPGMDGFELFRIVHRIQPDVKYRWIFISGYYNQDDPGSTIVHDNSLIILQKPITATELIHHVNDIINSNTP